LEKASNVLKNLLNNLMQKKKNREGEIYYHFYTKWQEIVGNRLYGHTKIIDIKNGCLIVAVDHPGWLQMLKFKDRSIITGIKRQFPQLHVTSMKMVVKEECFKIDKQIEKNEENDINKGKMDKIEKNKAQNIDKINEFENIKDTHLKNVLKRLYVSIIKKDEES